MHARSQVGHSFITEKRTDPPETLQSIEWAFNENEVIRNKINDSIKATWEGVAGIRSDIADLK